MSAATRIVTPRPLPAAVDAIRRWRISRLQAAGYEREAAVVLAFDIDIDVRRATRLLEQGCPHDLALQILL